MSNIDKHAVQAVADLKAGYTLGHADVAILNELARIALASLEARSRKLFTCGACGAEGLDEPLESKCNCCIDGAHWVESRVYTAPPAPESVPDGVLKSLLPDAEKSEFWFEHDGKILFEGVKFNNAVFDACRAAMLQGADGTLTNEGTIPVTQFKPVADLYGLTSPTGSETSFTFDAVEARDFIDGGWSCQEYVELGRFQEAMLQNGNSPAQSDCCPEQNYIAPAQDGDSPVIPDGWIPVSERMPGSQEWVIVFAKWDNQQVLCWDDVANRWTDFEDQSYYADMFTHWMPLPAAPQQEVK